MDRFRLLERIGSGGMGTVYRAYDERLEREVAVKEVADSDPRWVLREAQAAARLNHPGIVTLYEFGERDQKTLLVSELVRGRTLADLHRAGELYDRDVGEIACNLSEALAHAHTRGVVHRDIKPENVIVRDDVDGPQRAKLMDFGIARIAGAATLTEDGQVVGTLAYMSPEQAEGEVAGPESDVYSLAMTIYECLSGGNPVAAASPAATVRRIGLVVPPLRESRPDLPEALTEALDACLDPDPARRPTALELGECFDEELDRLEALPLAEDRTAGLARVDAARLGFLLAGAALLILLAGPLGAGGAALVGSLLALPLLAIGAPAVALGAPLGAVFAAIGAGSAASALGAAGDTPPARAVLGACTWAWLLCAGLVTGFGPELGIGSPAPAGWAADVGLAADSIVTAMISVESLVGAAVFAASAVLLGWVLSARHASIALLGAMLWAAGLDAALGLVGNGALSGSPALLVLGGAAAVAIEFRSPRVEPGAAPGRWQRASAFGREADSGVRI